MNSDFLWWKLTAGVLATIGLYSVLYRETKLYRLTEHLFLGLAAGFSIVAFWRDVLKEEWWDKMTGSWVIVDGQPTTDVERMGLWPYMVLLPIGMLGYFVFTKKHNWMSRIPIGIILGFWSGQQVAVWWMRWGPQIYSSMLPVYPTTWDSFTRPKDLSGMTPEQVTEVSRQLYLSEAVSNAVFVITLLAALSYFFFSFEMKSKFLKSANTLGRWLLMVGFGAIFGSTVMARFSLEIDRMAYIWLEWLDQTKIFFGG